MSPNKALWEKGDFTQIAAGMRDSGEALVASLGIGQGLKVPDLNAFEAAAKDGRADSLRQELDALFESQNASLHQTATSIPATFLRVTVGLN